MSQPQGLMILSPGGGEKEIHVHTVHCCHCQKMVAILEGPLTANFETYAHHRRCSRCNAALCKACAEEMKKTGKCNPFQAKFDHYADTGNWDENFKWDYKILPN